MTTRSRIASLERLMRPERAASFRDVIALLLRDPESARMAGRYADRLPLDPAMGDAERAEMDAAFTALMARAGMLMRNRVTTSEGVAA